MTTNLPPDMFPHMDWNTKDKLAVWSFYKEKLAQYFVITHTLKEDRVTHILFFGGKEASEKWTEGPSGRRARCTVASPYSLQQLHTLPK